MILYYFLSVVIILMGIAGYSISKDLKEYTDIGTVDEFKRLKNNHEGSRE